MLKEGRSAMALTPLGLPNPEFPPPSPFVPSSCCCGVRGAAGQERGCSQRECLGWKIKKLGMFQVAGHHTCLLWCYQAQRCHRATEINKRIKSKQGRI